MKITSTHKKLLLVLLATTAAGVSPNLFVVAQAGYSSLHHLAIVILFPSLLVLAILYILARFWEYTDVHSQIRNGIIAGLVATVGLELVRHMGFSLGGMPGDMPKLLGVLLFDRFAQGPSTWSTVAGYAYHFWNGAAFGILFSLIFGRARIWLATGYGILIGVGFMVSPVAIALGVGYFGVDFGWGFAATVTLAHIAYGLILGTVLVRLNGKAVSLLSRIRELF